MSYIHDSTIEKLEQQVNHNNVITYKARGIRKLEADLVNEILNEAITKIKQLDGEEQKGVS